MADEWSGMLLSEVNQITNPIHYRIHDVDTGTLVGFGSTPSGALQGMVAHCASVQAAYPGRHLVIRYFDREAGWGFPQQVGP